MVIGTDAPLDDVATPRQASRPTANAVRPSAVGLLARPSRLQLTWLARWVSSIGDGLVFVAFPLLATRLTHDAVLISGVVFAATLPWLLFALPAGALADRISRRRLLTTVETLRMVVLALLGVAAATHHLVLPELYAATFLVATFETAFDSATTAVIPQLVPRDDLVRANSRLQFAQLSGEQFIGPALGGLAVAVAASTPVFFDAASFAWSAVFLSLALRPARGIGRHGRPRRADGFVLAEPSHDNQPAILVQVKDGLRWLARDASMRLLCVLNASFAFCQALGLAVLVLYCTRVLHLTSTSFGVFSAAAAAGNAVGAWIAPRIHAALGAGRTLLACGLLGGAALFIVGLTSSTGVALAALDAEALAVGVGRVAIAALRQQLVPLELAGRVSAAVRSTVVGAAAVAALIGGGLVAVIGEHAPFAIGGLVQVAAAVGIGSALVRRLAADERQIIDVTDTVDLTAEPVEVV